MAIETLTIASLRAKTTNTADIYYTTDLGQEGEWYYDGNGAIGEDNTGTVIIGLAAPNMRFRRIYHSYIDVKWFGAKGDGLTDDIIPIQAAINYVTKTNYFDIWDTSTNTQNKFGGGTVFFPEGVYRITRNILVGANCSLLGVSNEGGYDFPDKNDGSSYTYRGSLILADYTQTGEGYFWTIQSACYYTSLAGTALAGTLLKWDEVGVNYDNYHITHCEGISIQNLAIQPTFGQYQGGGIKLSAAGCSNIKHVQILSNTKTIENTSLTSGACIGIMLSNCYESNSIEHVWMKIDVWGILVIYCAAVQINNCSINGFEGVNSLYPIEGDGPKFLGTYLFFTNELKLNNDVRLGRSGIWVKGSSNIYFSNTPIQNIYNGLILISTSSALNSLYFEHIAKYSIVCASHYENGYNGILTAENLTFNAPPPYISNICFFFGQGVFADISGVRPQPETDLYVNNYSSDKVRVISFSKTLLYAKRYYAQDIVFVDESPSGQNYGKVYVDSLNGNDENYGFNINDPIKTFDAALIRLQNQSTVNPFHTILIKYNTVAIKDASIKELENINVLILPYYTEGESGNATIKFDYILDGTYAIGQLKLKGNCNICFRNIDIVCIDPNTSAPEPPKLPNSSALTLLGLVKSKAILTFENLSINLTLVYSLIKSLESNSSAQINFTNCTVLGGRNVYGRTSLSPDNNAQNLLVDWTHINTQIPVTFFDYENYGWLGTELTIVPSCEAVFIDPVSGNDSNFGFTKANPLLTFDAALRRIQIQNGLNNAIKTIYIKGAPNTSESVHAYTGAAYKNLSIVPIENCDILIGSYGTDINHQRARIYFEGDSSSIAQVGQIELLGNVKLYFRNVDIVCNTPSTMPTDNRNITLFGLRHSYANLIFESDSKFYIIPDSQQNIDMSSCYCLVKANFNYDVLAIGPTSLLEIKFVNIEIHSGLALSPYQNGRNELAINCTQINSYQFTSYGWQDVVTIYNNL